MKKITCRELKGACDDVITGETAEEMGENVKKHATEAVQTGDQAHKEAMDRMMQMSKEDQEKWFADFKNKFDSLEEA